MQPDNFVVSLCKFNGSVRFRLGIQKNLNPSLSCLCPLLPDFPIELIILSRNWFVTVQRPENGTKGLGTKSLEVGSYRKLIFSDNISLDEVFTTRSINWQVNCVFLTHTVENLFSNFRAERRGKSWKVRYNKDVRRN